MLRSAILGFGSWLLLVSAANAEVLLTQPEALALAFAGTELQRHTAYLDQAQLDHAGSRAGADTAFGSAVVPYYTAQRDGEPLGAAYFDTHVVRTKAETVMVVVNPQGQVARVELLSFDEPPEYKPREPWLEQFIGEALDDDLALERSIRPMTGGSLTARGILRAVRRVLALHAVIAPFSSGETP